MDYDHVKKQLGYGIQTESKDNAIKAIEQLTARVRELEEENARLVSAIDEHMVVSHIGVFNRGDDPKDALNKIACYEQGIGEYFGKELRDQLAASQAYAEHLGSTE